MRLKIRNLLTNAVFDRTFKAGDKFKEPDLETVSASFLYQDGTAFHFLDQETFETHSLETDVLGNAPGFLTEGIMVELLKYNGNPIGLELPPNATLRVAFTEPGVRGDSLERQRHQARPPGDRPRNPRAALHQGRRTGEGLHRDRRIRGPRVRLRNPNAGRPAWPPLTEHNGPVAPSRGSGSPGAVAR